MISESAPPTIADHQLICPIAAGSYGEVWLARTTIGTLRAVKIVRRDRFENAEDFEREFRGLQSFEPVSRGHDGLVDVLQIGRNDTAGCFYYVMELADPEPGHARTPDRYVPRTLRSALAPGAFSYTEVLSLGLKLTGALQYLHAKGLVHRDIKPSNILVVGGDPKLADAGLVAPVNEARSLVGTIGYIAPEGPGTVQADIFALGKVLYEAAFGKDRQQFPQLPSDLLSHPAHRELLELNEVISKACAHDPRDRYANSASMRAELELLEHGGSVRRNHAIRRWVSRGAQLAIPASILLLIVLAIGWRKTGYAHSTVAEVDGLVDQANLALRGETPEDVQRAEKFIQQALRMDPKYAPALYTFCAVDVHQLNDQMMPRLRSTADELIRVAPDSIEAWQMKAFIEWEDRKYLQAVADAEYGVKKCRAYCREGEAWGHGALGFFLQGIGEADRALAEYRKAAKIYRAEPTILDHLGHPYYMRGNFAEALKYYEASLDLQPKHPNGLYWKAHALEELERFDEAIQTRAKGDLVRGEYDMKREQFYRELSAAARASGRAGYWAKWLEEAQKKDSPDLYKVATYYMRLGQREKAYESLEQAYVKDFGFQSLLFDPCWDRNDEWFKAFVRKVGLRK